jgi:hypothetical protein
MRAGQSTDAGSSDRLRRTPARDRPQGAAPRHRRPASDPRSRPSGVSATPLAVCIACWLALAFAAGLVAADRDARVITPRGSPVWLDPLRALLFDSPGVLVILENQHSQPVASALRVWIFDPDLRLKASIDYCAIEQLDRRTRGSVFVPLEVSGITLRDRAVVTIAGAGTAGAAHTTWRLRESDAEQLAAARDAAQGSGGQLTLDREDGRDAAWECPCEQATIEASCAERCAYSGPAAHWATRMLNAGCSASCTCR